MDLGINGKKAIVCAASKGLGKACAMSLAMNGVDLVINSRTVSELEATAAEICAATGRTGLVSIEKAFHGLTNGSLSVMGDVHFQEGFGPLLDNCSRIALGDITALKTKLEKRDVAAFIIERCRAMACSFRRMIFT